MPGMVIKPSFGLAALNGLTPLKVEITPREVLKFDARVLIQIRGGKQLELRLSGESEEPMIDIDLVSQSHRLFLHLISYNILIHFFLAFSYFLACV